MSEMPWSRTPQRGRHFKGPAGGFRTDPRHRWSAAGRGSRLRSCPSGRSRRPSSSPADRRPAAAGHSPPAPKNAAQFAMPTCCASTLRDDRELHSLYQLVFLVRRWHADQQQAIRGRGTHGFPISLGSGSDPVLSVDCVVAPTHHVRRCSRRARPCGTCQGEASVRGHRPSA